MANGNRVSEILQEIVGQLKDIARSQTVVGEPITAGDKTVIPLVKISVGFGAGGGQGESPDKGGGFGGGGGGGVRIEPYAFIIMEKDRISMLSARAGKFDNLIEAVPALIGKIMEVREKIKHENADKPSESHQHSE